MKKHSSRAVPPMRNPFARPITPPHKDNLASLFGILGTLTLLLIMIFNLLNNRAAPASVQMLVLTPTVTTSPALVAADILTLKACVTTSEIRIRQGPGTDSEVTGGLVPGTCLRILGRNQDASWVYIVTEDNTNGWVAAWLLTIEGDLNRVSVRSASSELAQ